MANLADFLCNKCSISTNPCKRCTHFSLSLKKLPSWNFPPFVHFYSRAKAKSSTLSFFRLYSSWRYYWQQLPSWDFWRSPLLISPLCTFVSNFSWAEEHKVYLVLKVQYNLITGKTGKRLAWWHQPREEWGWSFETNQQDSGRHHNEIPNCAHFYFCHSDLHYCYQWAILRHFKIISGRIWLVFPLKLWHNMGKTSCSGSFGSTNVKN